IMITGWVHEWGVNYYFANNGQQVRGLQTIGNKVYNFNNHGIMQTGWQTIDNHVYKFNDQGIMITGWVHEWGVNYYFANNGQQVRGLQTIDNKIYKFNNQGVMIGGVLTAPIIDANSKTINQGAMYNNSMLNATVNEGASISYSGNVNTNAPGQYIVKIIATSPQGLTTTIIEKVTVIASKYTKVHYNMTMDKYVAGEIKEYKASMGKNLSKEQVTNLKSHINPNDSKSVYQFLNVASYRDVNEQGLAKELNGKGMLSGQAQNFINAAKLYNIDPLYFISQSMLETGKGSSNFAKGITITEALVPEYKDNKLVYGKNGNKIYVMKKLDKPVKVYNLFGIGAYDNDPTVGATSYAYNHGWTSIPKAIDGAAKFLSTQYIRNQIKQATPYELRYINSSVDNMWHQYATEIDYASNIAYYINKLSYLYDSNDVFTFNTPEFNK
ncbi:glucosaminidase domain-containing protein, partial [uncultured Clostridium sp.]|uniref:glucosaminidase domain-containing protein n=1 Tax=uncultured Clostridium sp. TaxID=59620 RepID=UPI0026183B65